MADHLIDVAIVGAGPAGLAAALYSGRNQLKTALFEEKLPGGELLNTGLIEDYPGREHVLGSELATEMSRQALSFGAKLISAKISSIVGTKQGRWRILTNEKEYLAKSVILTAGGNPRKLGVPGEEEFAGRGVSYCAICDGAFFKGVDLAVIGGGDAALEEGVFLTRYAKSVTIIHRREEFRAQPILLASAKKNPKIKFLTSKIVTSISGQEGVEHIELTDVKTNQPFSLPIKGVFIFVGFIPNGHLIKGHLDHDQNGYVITDPFTLMTSRPGLFAAGDVRHQLTRQITTAVGDGTTAAMAVLKYLEK